MDVRKAVIPAAGFGTRFLPVTKAQPKEMMPVLDKPTIQYTVEEAVEAGIDDILIITGRGEQAIERHFDKSYELERELAADGKQERLERIQEISSLADIHYIRQKERNGLGDAVLQAQEHIGNEPFAILLGDTIVQSQQPCIERLISYGTEYESSVVSLERVPQADIPKYGIAKVNNASTGDPCFQVQDVIEKPTLDEAPSNLAITGRYVLTPNIFDRLQTTDPGTGNELQLTDAIRKLEHIRGVELAGDRYDIGTIPDWLQANIEMAIQHDNGKMSDVVESQLQKYIQ